MASVNKAILNGDRVCNLRLATTDSWKDKVSGEKRETTEWHRIVLYRKLAEIAGQYLRKGSQVYVEGRIRTRKWEDKDGRECYSTEIEADEMMMLGGKGQGIAHSPDTGTSDEAWPDEFCGTKGSTHPPEWIDDLPF